MSDKVGVGSNKSTVVCGDATTNSFAEMDKKLPRQHGLLASFWSVCRHSGLNMQQSILGETTYLVQLFHSQGAQDLALVAFEGPEQCLVDVLGALCTHTHTAESKNRGAGESMG